jgi:hypothetical protein
MERFATIKAIATASLVASHLRFCGSSLSTDGHLAQQVVRDFAGLANYSAWYSAGYGLTGDRRAINTHHNGRF